MVKRFMQIVLALLFVSGTSLAAISGTSRANPEFPSSSEAVSGPEDDGGNAEVGVEWITDWPGTADDRTNWYYSATNLYNELGDAGWTRRFNYGNTSAWEKDFKAAMYGGINDYIIDSVDLALIGTHGSSAYDARYGRTLSSVYFSTNNHDWHLSPGEAYRAYGNNDLEWLAFDSCSVLRDDSMYYWHESFDGLHLMLGFANTMYVVYPGDGGKWGDQMRAKGWWIFGHGAKTVTQAWFSAVEDQQPSGVRARVLAEELNSYNDYIWGQGYVSPDYPNDGDYWYWDHVSGTPDPLQLAGEPTSLPAVQLLSPEVNLDYVMNIGLSFGLDSEILQSPDGSAFYMTGGISNTKQLRVDTASGGFFYQDLSQLWTDPERPRTLPQSPREAAALALDFLARNDNLPGAFDFDPQIDPTIELEGPTLGAQAGAALVAGAEPTHPMNYAISYARTVDIGGQLLSIVGPGSRQNLYIGDNGEVIGMKGGWRPAQVVPGSSIPIITSDEAWAGFLADPTIALAQAPHATFYDRTGKPAPTLGYYEQPSMLGQSELIPVWIFVADLYAPTTITPTVSAGAPAGELGLVASDTKLYIPASAESQALPQATILSPAPGTTLGLGETVDLSGAAGGGTAPYTYEWSSSVDGLLGSGESLSDVQLHPDLRSQSVEANIITLRVIDANGLIATTSVVVNVPIPLYLPAVQNK